MQVEDETRLNDKDQRERNKKKRYEARHQIEETVREETLAEQQRLDEMSLKKVSHQRVAEELSRGFDILTNGELRGGLAKIKATSFMQQQPKAWDKIGSPRNAEATECAANASATPSNQANIDFQATSFDRRSRRLNASAAAKDPSQASSVKQQQPVQSEVQSRQSAASKPSGIAPNPSQRSNLPPTGRSQLQVKP